MEENQFDFNDKSIISVEKHFFEGMNLVKIDISWYDNLEKIHCNSFGKQSNQIKEFRAEFLPKLKSQSNTKYDLFKLINSLTNCEVIKMHPFFDELQRIKLKNLKRIELNDEYE